MYIILIQIYILIKEIYFFIFISNKNISNRLSEKLERMS